MNSLLDTNILIYLSRDIDQRLLKKIINPTDKQIFISVASLGELKSTSIQNSWGKVKWKLLDSILEECVLVEINENLIETYAGIDAFSQRKNKDFGNYSFETPRNMGKNDLWIAATAALLGLNLITTDSDFDHLHRIFLEVTYLTAKQLISIK